MHVVRTPNQFPIFLFPCCLCINLAINPWQNSPMYQSLIPKCTTFNRNVHTSVKKWCIVGYCLMPSGICEMGLLQTPSFQHCLHMRNLDSDLDYFLIFRCKHSQLAGCGFMSTWLLPWLEIWDVATIYTEGTRVCVTLQWMSVDCMTLSPAK